MASNPNKLVRRSSAVYLMDLKVCHRCQCTATALSIWVESDSQHVHLCLHLPVPNIYPTLSGYLLEIAPLKKESYGVSSCHRAVRLLCALIGRLSDFRAARQSCWYHVISNTPRLITVCGNRCWKNAFWITMLLYPRCSATALQMFAYDSLDTGRCDWLKQHKAETLWIYSKQPSSLKESRRT